MYIIDKSLAVLWNVNEQKYLIPRWEGEIMNSFAYDNLLSMLFLKVLIYE